MLQMESGAPGVDPTEDAKEKTRIESTPTESVPPSPSREEVDQTYSRLFHELCALVLGGGLQVAGPCFLIVRPVHESDGCTWMLVERLERVDHHIISTAAAQAFIERRAGEDLPAEDALELAAEVMSMSSTPQRAPQRFAPFRGREYWQDPRFQAWVHFVRMGNPSTVNVAPGTTLVHTPGEGWALQRFKTRAPISREMAADFLKQYLRDEMRPSANWCSELARTAMFAAEMQSAVWAPTFPCD